MDACQREELRHEDIQKCKSDETKTCKDEESTIKKCSTDIGTAICSY